MFRAYNDDETLLNQLFRKIFGKSDHSNLNGSLFDQLIEKNQVRLIHDIFRIFDGDLLREVIRDLNHDEMYMIELICKFIVMVDFDKYPPETVNTLSRTFFTCMVDVFSSKPPEIVELHVELYGLFVAKILHFSTELSRSNLRLISKVVSIFFFYLSIPNLTPKTIRSRKNRP